MLWVLKSLALTSQTGSLARYKEIHEVVSANVKKTGLKKSSVAQNRTQVDRLLSCDHLHNELSCDLQQYRSIVWRL